MILHPPSISTRDFLYHAPTKTFTAEISTLGENLRLGQVYDDACDEGFTLVSAKTGEEIVFVHDVTEKHDGDILAWYYVPAKKGENRVKQVVIFND